MINRFKALVQISVNAYTTMLLCRCVWGECFSGSKFFLLRAYLHENVNKTETGRDSPPESMAIHYNVFLFQAVKDQHMFAASTIRRAIEMKAPFLQCIKYFHTISCSDLLSKLPY